MAAFIQFLHHWRWPSRGSENARHSRHSHKSASRGARISGLPVSLSLRPVRLFASLGGSDRVAPANRDFYFQASDELVTRPIAGYDYGSNWTISAGGTFTHKNSS